MYAGVRYCLILLMVGMAAVPLRAQGQWRGVEYLLPGSLAVKPIKGVLHVTATELQLATRRGALIFVIRLADVTDVEGSSVEHRPSLLLRILLGRFAPSSFHDRVRVAFRSDSGPQLVVLKVEERTAAAIAGIVRNHAIAAGADLYAEYEAAVASDSVDSNVVGDADSAVGTDPPIDEHWEANGRIEPTMEDSIVLADGSSVRGQIIDSTLGDSVTIRRRGLRYRFSRASVVRVVRHRDPAP